MKEAETRTRGPSPGELARAFAAFALLLCVPLARGLFDGDRVLFAVDTATVQAPWSVDGAGDGVPRQPGQADQGTFFYPAYRHTLERLVDGDLPLWNPKLFAGVPHLANPQTGVLDPQVLALGLLELAGGRELADQGFAWLAWLRLVAAGVGAYVLARRLARRPTEAALAGFAFAGAGHVVLWLNHSLGHVVPFLPWLLVAIDAARVARPVRSVATVAVLFLGAILGGHPETAFALGLVGGLWTLASSRGRERALALGGLALGTLAGAVLLVPFVEYLAQSAALAARATSRHALDLVAVGAMLIVLALVRAAARDRRPFALVCACAAVAVLGWRTLPASAWLALWPDGFGATWAGGYRGPGHASEAGSVWLALPVVGLFLASWLDGGDRERAGRAREIEIWIRALATVSFVLALGLEPLVALVERVPVVGWVAPARWAAISALFVPLAATGALRSVSRAARLAVLATLITAGVVVTLRPRAPRPAPVEAPPAELVRIDACPPAELASGPVDVRGWITPELAVDDVRLALVPVELRGASPNERLELGLDRSSTPWPESRSGAPGAEADAGTWFRASGLDAAHLSAGTWELRLVLARGGDVLDELPIGRTLVDRRPWPSSRTLVFAAATCLVLALPSVPSAFLLAIAVAQILVFARGRQPAVPRAEVFPPTATEAIVARELGHGRFLADPGVLPPSTGLVRGLASIQGYDALDVHRFNALRPYVQHAGAHPLLGWNARGIDLDRPASALLGVGVVVTTTPLEDPDWELVAGPDARRAPSFAATWIHVRRERSTERAFCVADVVPRATALTDLERFDPRRTVFVAGDDVVLAQPFDEARVAFVEDEPESVELAVALDGDGLLVLCDTWYPGWTVDVDGAPARLLRVDDVMRGVVLGAGEHRVRFTYRPASLRLGATLTAAAVVLFALFAWRVRRRAQRPSTSRA